MEVRPPGSSVHLIQDTMLISKTSTSGIPDYLPEAAASCLSDIIHKKVLEGWILFFVLFFWHCVGLQPKLFTLGGTEDGILPHLGYIKYTINV